jgi:hypothetical protein
LAASALKVLALRNGETVMPKIFPARLIASSQSP